MNAVASMTGFGRAEGSGPVGSWQWEVKSVNGRGLEVRCRLANGLDRLEPAVRQRVAAVCRRGNLSVALRLSCDPAQRRVLVNKDLVQRILDAAKEVAGTAGSKPSLDAVFAIPGVVEIVDALDDPKKRESLDTDLLESLDTALASLRNSQQIEGAHIAELCAGHLAEINERQNAAAKLAAAQPERIRERLTERLAVVLEKGAVPEERLSQEVAMLAVKADVREELDRLAAHVISAQAVLTEGGLLGRKLDSLAQELFREANTLCSKSSNLELTQSGLELKAAINHLREQVQNLE